MILLLPAVQLLLSAASLRAAFEEQDRQLPWAVDAASASAFNAVREGVESTVYNPAALGFGERLQVGASGGNGGREADWALSSGILWPLQDDLSAGLAWRGLFGAAGPGFGEQSLGLSAALEPWSGVSLGLRPWVHQASTPVGLRGSGMGFSLDAGLRWKTELGRGLRLQTGWWGSQLAGEWPDRFWRRAVPVANHGAVSLGWPKWGDVGLALEQSSMAGRDLPLLWRAGLQFNRYRRWQAGLGASNDAAAAWTAGVQAPVSIGRTHWMAAYALMLPAQGSDMRHRVQLNMGFEVRQRAVIAATPLRVVYEPGTKRVKAASISLNVAAATQAQAWELEIRDKSGKLIRVLSGEGTPPAMLNWDGKDTLGEVAENGEELSFKLNIKTASGLRSSEPSYGLETAQAGGLELLPTADTESLVVPVMGEDGKVTQLGLRPPSNVPGEAKRWQIVVQNEAGETLRTLEGEGPVPQELLWDGQTDGGTNALDQPGLRVRFNAWDQEGQLSSTDQSLGEGLQPIQDEEEPLPQLGLKLPAFREGGPPMTLLLSDASLHPLSELFPTPVPTRMPTPQPSPTPSPSAVPTVAATPRPSFTSTPWPTAAPTPVPPTAVSSPVPPTAVPTPIAAVDREAGAIGAGLSRPNYLASPDLLPPVFMTREQAEGPRPRRPVSGGPSRPRLPSTIDGVLDVFLPDSDALDPAQADKLQAFFWRLGGFKTRRILLTGLVGEAERGGEALSRQRVRVLSRLMVEEGGFAGEFILKVDGDPGPVKGVRIEVLRR